MILPILFALFVSSIFGAPVALPSSTLGPYGLLDASVSAYAQKHGGKAAGNAMTNGLNDVVALEELYVFSEDSAEELDTLFTLDTSGNFNKFTDLKMAIRFMTPRSFEWVESKIDTRFLDFMFLQKVVGSGNFDLFEYFVGLNFISPYDAPSFLDSILHYLDDYTSSLASPQEYQAMANLLIDKFEIDPRPSLSFHLNRDLDIDSIRSGFMMPIFLHEIQIKTYRYFGLLEDNFDFYEERNNESATGEQSDSIVELGAMGDVGNDHLALDIFDQDQPGKNYY